MCLNSFLLGSVRLDEEPEIQATLIYHWSGMLTFRAIIGEGKLARKIGREKRRSNSPNLSQREKGKLQVIQKFKNWNPIVVYLESLYGINW